MNDLKVALVQMAIQWENPIANLEILDTKLEGLDQDIDLIVLPEMFTTGFSMDANRLAEKMDGISVQWMREKAKELNAVIAGSLIIKENGNFYNRLVWMNPDGTYEKYDKRHLFTLAKEHHTFTNGNEKLLVDIKGWKVFPLICYDLRFPVWSRNTDEYDVLLYTANFPAKRRYAWRHLLRARAIENQCFVLGVNIVGEDGNQFKYAGDTSVIDPSGHLIKEVTDKEAIIVSTISKSAISQLRNALPFLNDRDTFTIV